MAKSKRKSFKAAKSAKGAVKGYSYRTQPQAFTMDPVVRFYRSIGVRSQ